MALRPGLLAGALIGAAACTGGAPSVEVAWTGADTGAAELPASATRCGAGPIALLAISGDTGIAIALYAAGEPAAGSYPVSTGAASAAPPAASVGARWLDSTNVAAWRGGRGTVTLSQAGARLAGSFTVEAKRLDTPDSVTLTGSFRGVPVGPCRPDSAVPGV
jgi:hypothetical protein